MKRALTLIVLIVMAITLCSCDKQASIPSPSPNSKSKFGVDKNINMTTIDNYLGRDDVAYRDVRMLIDPADFKSIGGDANLSKTIKGFKIVPYPYIATLPQLPVKGAYSGKCLFTLTWNKDGKLKSATANYKESMMVLKDLFPKDKKIFLMCGGGGYSAMMKSLLIYLGWDADLLYNIGGEWEYKGKNSLELIKYSEDANGKNTYATWRADYAYIDFNLLNPVA